MHKITLIALAGALGTIMRYGTQSALAAVSERFPWGTLAANLLGCFLIGFLQALFADRWLLRPEHRTAILVGFLGGYTTFSTFGWETAALLQDAQYLRATSNVVISNLAGIAMVIAGYAIGART